MARKAQDKKAQYVADQDEFDVEAQSIDFEERQVAQQALIQSGRTGRTTSMSSDDFSYD